MAEHNDFGKLGEDIACKHLEQKGYTIITRNWRFDRAEIDIIATFDNILVFVEVKIRATNDFGLPQEFITKGKILQVTKAANAYIEQEDIEQKVRFDIVAITKNDKKFDVLHIEDAFYFW
jgi:putative endonuclease